MEPSDAAGGGAGVAKGTFKLAAGTKAGTAAVRGPMQLREARDGTLAGSAGVW